MLPRVLEPEVMDTAEEARDYDAMDHAAVNTVFVSDLLGEGALGIPVLDVGTGTARIPIEIARRNANAELVAIDLADHMLAVAKTNVESEGLSVRVKLQKADAKGLGFQDNSFGAAISNSIIHHIPEPAHVLAEMWRVLRSRGLLFVRDLHRPESLEELDTQTAHYAGQKPVDPTLASSFENQRKLLRDSLHASLTVDEVRTLVAPLGIAPGNVKKTSDRHWTLSARKP